MGNWLSAPSVVKTDKKEEFNFVKKEVDKESILDKSKINKVLKQIDKASENSAEFSRMVSGVVNESDDRLKSHSFAKREIVYEEMYNDNFYPVRNI